jgi:uncharacterized protein
MKTLLSVLSVFIWALLAPFAAHADAETPPACSGRDLYKELEKSDPEGFAKLEAERVAIKNEGPLLWKIVPPNGAAPSYLLGTAHVTDTRIATVSDSVKEKIANSKVLALELKEIANANGIVIAPGQHKALVNMPDGKKVWDVIPDELEAKLKAHPKIKVVPANVIDNVQPWFLLLQVNEPPCETQRKASRFVLDQALVQRAQFANVPVIGLETFEEQLAVFSGTKSIEEQVKDIDNYFKSGISAEDMFHTIKELYVSRRISAAFPLIWYLGEKSGVPSSYADKAFFVALIDKRNVNMADRAVPYLDKGAAFIGVGAAHLPGDVGVVELLKKKGYKLVPAE